jgi:hypothetical protein
VAWNWDPLASASQVLESQACITILIQCYLLSLSHFIFSNSSSFRGYINWGNSSGYSHWAGVGERSRETGYNYEIKCFPIFPWLIFYLQVSFPWFQWKIPCMKKKWLIWALGAFCIWPYLSFCSWIYFTLHVIKTPATSASSRMSICCRCLTVGQWIKMYLGKITTSASHGSLELILCRTKRKKIKESHMTIAYPWKAELGVLEFEFQLCVILVVWPWDMAKGTAWL